MQEQLSIHPRNWKTGNGRIKNTCAARGSRMGGQGGKTLRRVAKRLAVRLRDWATIPASDREGFRKPGSMKP